jgi:hypothetical protein
MVDDTKIKIMQLEIKIEDMKAQIRELMRLILELKDRVDGIRN